MCSGLRALAVWIFSFVLHGQPSDSDITPPAANSLAAVPIDPAPKLSPQPTGKQGFDWGAATRQSAFFAGIQHAFRLGTEPGTRRGMKGPFWGGYVDSVGNMHGWGDGDPFLVNYIGHPIQGAVSGYIYIQNSPGERALRFGSDRRYWRSRMKAMGAAWAYSTLFELGPVSEASIGKIQSRRPQQGFVDHVVTPIIGTGWMIAEDFLDEKVALPFENRFENTWARMMVRSWLNPTRSFSNAMRLKVPWYRDTRGGILAPNYRAPFVLAPEGPRLFPKAAPFELTAIPIWTRFEDTQCAGGGGQAAFRVEPNWQIVGQLSGCQLRNMAPNRSGDALSYMIGPRWTPLAEKRFSPFVQVLLGGKKITRYETNVQRKALLTAQAKRENKAPPPEELYLQGEIRHGFGFSVGTGLDVRLHPAFALRLATVEYTRSWIGPMDGLHYNRGLQLSSGFILRMGTW